MANSTSDKIGDLYIELAEHRAYNECVEFPGDVCYTCVEIHDEIDALRGAPEIEVDALTLPDDGWDEPFEMDGYERQCLIDQAEFYGVPLHTDDPVEHHVGGWVARAQQNTLPVFDTTNGAYAYAR